MNVDMSREHGRHRGDGNDDRRKAGVRRTALLLAGVALMVYAAFIIASVLRS